MPENYAFKGSFWTNSGHPFYKAVMTLYFGGTSGDLLADRRYSMALQLAEWGDHSAAADLLRQGLEYAPTWPPFHFQLGESLRQTGDMDGAQNAFSAYLLLDSDDKMGATLKLSIMGCIPAPDTLPEGYVQSLFDQYAPSFEKCLVENLSYNTPVLMAQAVRNTCKSPYGRLLDLGCGTGLAAKEFMTDTNYRCGVDLSPVMIDQAKNKNIYHEAHAQSIESFLAENQNASYDLVLAADVFVYIGALQELFSLIANSMSQNGIFAFSVQAEDKKNWVLGEDHRYAHSKEYIEECCSTAGMIAIYHEQIILRQDAGHPVNGLIFIAKKP